MGTSALANCGHVCKKHSKAAKQQDGSCRQRDPWNQARRNCCKCDNCHDLQGERAIVDEQTHQFTKDCSQHVHGKASRLLRRATMTATRPTTRNSAAEA